jgi:hypothetical protein
MMKEDLCLAGEVSKCPDMIQRTPRKLNIGPNQKVLSATVDEEQTIHLILKNQLTNKIQYGKYDIGTVRT